MKKLITLLSLLFILTSCWGKKDNTDVNVDTNSGTQIEENIPANTTVDIEEIQIETDSTIYDNLSGSELQEVTSSGNLNEQEVLDDIDNLLNELILSAENE